MQTTPVPIRKERQRRSAAPEPCFRSPLRYPGGKTAAVPQLLQFLPNEPGVLVSPFFGGGSVELALAARGWQVHGYDAFPPLVEFWQLALTDPAGLADGAVHYLPLTKAEFRELQTTCFRTSFERAVAFFVLNRSSFSGSTLSGGMSPGHPRFNRKCIDRLREFSTSDLWVEQADFHNSIAGHPDATIYADSPYPDAHSLYGTNGDMHDGFDHDGLRDLMRSRGNWVLSYSDCPLVRRLYDGYRILPLTWKYSMSSNKQGHEVVILSHDLADRIP